MDDKHRRARAICDASQSMAKSHGKLMPAHYPGCPEHACVVELLPLRIEFSPNRYRTYMRKSPTMIGDSTIEREGWVIIEIRWHNEVRACFNVGPDQIDIHRFQPGRWELEFGVDPGLDTVPVLPDIFADDKEPAWREFKTSSWAKWPPELPSGASTGAQL